jgi:hypothetical protein
MRRLAKLCATLSASLLLSALGAGAAAAQTPTSASANTAKTAGGSTAIRPGTYDLEVAFGGGVLQGTLDLTAIGDSLAAKLHVGEHDPAVRSITRKDNHLLVDAGTEGMQLVYDFKFDGDAVSGSFTMNGDAGLVTGKRRK